jgi:hypothetical protein
MNKNRCITIAIVATALLASPVVQAAPLNISLPVHAMFGNQVKSVKLSLRNASSAPLELKIEDKVVTLNAGQTIDLKLPVGTRILANNATPTHEAGSLIEEVRKDHDGVTIVIR